MRRSKYGAKRTSCGVHEHASKKEARRCGILRVWEMGKAIRNLRFQPEFDLQGIKYRADFEYDEINNDGALEHVVEDTKGFKTAVYKLKKRLMKNIHGIEIRET